MPRPNFIVFLTDDQGYGDLSCMGATDFRTPNLDELTTGGTRFTDWYSNSPVCSPSRASLLTGRYPGNAGVRAILGGNRKASGLPPQVPTLATALKKLGYQTAMFGKWHLGLAEQCRPHNHGFDQWFGFMAGCIDYYSHIFYWALNRPGGDPTHDLWQNGREVYRNGEYFTDMIANHAVDYIRRVAASDKPFFLYVPFNAPHYPMHAPQKYIDRFKGLAPDRRIMAAMLSAMDDGVGAIVEELKKQKIFDNTCIFFTSDNGPSRETRNWLDGRTDPYYGGSAGKLKGHKFSLYEGGIRVPAILHYPQVVPQEVSARPCASMDIFPTFLKLAGGNPAEYEINGADIFSPAAQRDLMWEMDQQTAIRRGKWKLVLDGQLVEGAPPEDRVHLSDLSNDMGERVNLIEREPQITAELTAACQAWRNGIESRWRDEWLAKKNGTT